MYLYTIQLDGRRDRKRGVDSPILTLLLTCDTGVDAVKAKFHYASWFGAGSKLVRSLFVAGFRSRFGAGSELKFSLSFTFLAAN